MPGKDATRFRVADVRGFESNRASFKMADMEMILDGHIKNGYKVLKQVCSNVLN